MFYIITVSVATAVITAVSFIFGGVYTFLALAARLGITLLYVAAVFVIDGVSAFIIRRLPEKWFSPLSGAFGVCRWERNLYRRSKIIVWKKFVPEWGCFTGFHKDKLRAPKDSDYIARFLLESNYGVAGHIAGAVLGFAIIFIPIAHPLIVALPVAAVNALLSLLPTAVLRSNTPALRGLYVRNLNREKEEEGSKESSDIIS